MILFPMAGLSSRFFDAGYTKPKYMLEYGGETLFRHVVSGFSTYFGQEPLVFTCRPDYSTVEFVTAELHNLGLGDNDFRIDCLWNVTKGQADTVFKTLKNLHLETGPLTIFNVDTVRPGFSRLLDRSSFTSGYLEVVRAEGDHWSFVLPQEKEPLHVGLAAKVVEKERISNLCSTGLYHFNDVDIFNGLFRRTYLDSVNEPPKLEQYIAPIYQTGIDSGMKFNYLVLETTDVDFCGTPQEYEQLKTKFEA